MDVYLRLICGIKYYYIGNFGTINRLCLLINILNIYYNIMLYLQLVRRGEKQRLNYIFGK